MREIPALPSFSSSPAMSRILGDTPNGEETLLHLFGPGECLGELALLDGGPRSATAVALGCVAALMLDRETFLALLEQRPEVARAVMGSLAGTVRRV